MVNNSSPLSQVAEIIDSLHKTPQYSDKGKPMIRVTDVKYGELKTKSAFKVNEEVFAEFSKRYTPQHGDIIITRVGSYGNTAFVVEENFCLGQNTAAIIPKINRRYLYHVLNSPQLKAQIEASVVGSTQKTLSLKAIGNLLIPRFTDDIESYIGDVLGTLDQKISLNESINQTLEEMAQAIFKSWFVDFDPVKAKAQVIAQGGSEQDANLAAMQIISGKTRDQLAALERAHPEQYTQLHTTASLFPSAFVDSELGEIPEGWEVQTLMATLEELETGSRPKGGVSGITSGIPSIGAENIIGIGNYNYGKEKFIPDEFYGKMKRGKIKNFDVLLYKDGGKPGEFKPRVSMFGHSFPYKKCVINEHVFRMRSRILGQCYLYFLIGSERVLAELGSKGAKAAIPGINQKDVTSTQHVTPSQEVLSIFDNTISPIINSILSNSFQIKRLSETRDNLLPKLLSGEIDVSQLHLND